MALVPNHQMRLTRLYFGSDEALQRGEVVRVGTPMDLSFDGRHYLLSSQMISAFDLFFSWHVEVHGGVLVNGTPHGLELILMDGGSTDTAGPTAEYLLRHEGMRLFLGPYSSGVTNPVARAVDAAGAVQVAPGAAYSECFKGRPSIFGTLMKNARYSESVLELLAAADDGAKKTLWILSERSIKSTKAVAARNSISVINESVLPAMPDWPALVTDLIRGGPDIVLISSLRCAGLVHELWKRHHTPKALVLELCPASVDFIAAVGDAGQYAIHVTPWLPSLPFQGPLTGSWTAQSFAVEFQQRNGATPGYQVASAFVSAATLVRGIEGAGSLEPQAVADAIRSIHLDSIFGTVSFDADGQNTGKMLATQYQMTESPRLLYPCKVCEGTLVYPKPNRSFQECMDPRPELKTFYGWLDGMCRQCPLGMKSEGSQGQAWRVCTACAPGRYGAQDAQGLSLVCWPCRPGYFSAAEGASSCTACPRGRFADAGGAANCTVCAVGHGAKAPGAQECKSCTAGKYANETEMSECVRCEVGRYGRGTAAISCEACPATLSTLGMGFASASDCACREGTFPAAAAAKCEPCPMGLRCRGFGAALELLPGYHELAGALDLHRGVWRCAVEGACPGGAPGTCSGGLRGIACGSCPPGFWRSGGIRCERCSWGQGVLPVAVCLGLIAAAVGLYYLANGRVVKATSVQLGISIMCGLAINVVQQVGMITRLKVPWPAGAGSMMDVCAYFVPDGEVLSTECSAARAGALPYFVVFLMPFGVLTGFLLLVAASRLLPLLGRGCLKSWTWTHSFNAICSLWQACYIVLANLVAVSVQCYSHPNGKMSMVKYPGILCFEPGPHVGILVMGLILLLAFVVPFLVICLWGSYSVLRGTMARGGHAPQLRMYRFLVFRYQPTVWWWGNVFNVRQLILGFAPMIHPDQPGIQLMLMQAVMLTSLALTTYFLPWRSLEINIFDLVTHGLLYLAMGAGAGFLPAARSSTSVLPGMLMVIVLAPLAVAASAVLYALALALQRGLQGTFGVSFPLPHKMDRFAAEWAGLVRAFAQLEWEDQRTLIFQMSSFERMFLDHTMRVLAVSLGVANHRGTSEGHSGWSTAARCLDLERVGECKRTGGAREEEVVPARSEWSRELDAVGGALELAAEGALELVPSPLLSKVPVAGASAPKAQSLKAVCVPEPLQC